MGPLVGLSDWRVIPSEATPHRGRLPLTFRFCEACQGAPTLKIEIDHPWYCDPRSRNRRCFILARSFFVVTDLNSGFGANEFDNAC